MLLLDHPFVSDYLRRTIVEHQLPVVDTAQARSLALPPGTEYVEEATAVRRFERGEARLLYSNSENSLGWAAERLAGTDLPRQIAALKDKVYFRELLAPLYPDFTFRAVAAAQLAQLNVAALPFPFIIKPAVGFFSLGVHKVNSPAAWPRALAAIQEDLARQTAVFPAQVLDTSTFIIEACIPGEEYAIDAYYDDGGEPVILNIMQHPFSSADDVSDRAYLTSKKILSRNLAPFADLLREVGQLAGLCNFPIHAEVRVAEGGRIVPIEFNPLRFGGWCAVDMAHYAFGLNPYLMFLEQRRPHWTRILDGKGEEITALIVLDRSGAAARADVVRFDEERLLARFTKPLDWRPIDFRRYPVFGFLFVETPGAGRGEIDAILGSDLTEFARLDT